MLSAVELHSGGGSGFYPSYSRPPVSSDVQFVPPMSGSTEFARPKPKIMNGLSPSATSPPHKYSHHHEQNGPVNLAVNHQTSRQSMTQDKESSDKEIDVVGLGNTSSSFATTSSPRISTSSYPTGLGSNAYHSTLNYNFYGNRYSAPIFPHRSAYSQHHPSRPTYLPSQLEAYPSYLSAAAAAAVASYGSSSYSSSPLTQSSADTLSQSIPHKSANERSHSMSSMTNGHHQHHPYPMKEKEPKSAGPRLIGNEDTRNVSINSNGSSNNNNFKVPSGKEGSLKHRILTTTRPHENNNNKHGTINHPANRSPISSNSYLNFTRGSLIELSNGSLRRVEDLRTEDFVMSAEKSQDLQLADSTVVKILPATNNYVMITFSYDNNRSKVDIEAKMEHPFFVYGQGWASCDPDGSMQAFGLKCQRLQVGDVCISLKPREQKSPPLSPMAQKRPREIFQPPTKEHQPQPELMPQNLSRRPSTIPTTATETTITSSQIGQYSPSLYNLQMSLFAAASQGRIPSYAPFLNQDDVSAHLQTHDINTSLNNNNNNNSPDKLPMLMSKNASITDDYDDLQSRKRRWSAPDIDSDEQQTPRKISN